MKKIFLMSFLIIIVYSIMQFNKAFTEVIKNEDYIEIEKIEGKDKIEVKNEKLIDENEFHNDDNIVSETIEDNNTLNNSVEEIQKNDENYSSPIELQESVYVYEFNNQTEESINYEIYSVNGIPKEYESYDECKNDSISVSFSTDARTMCYESLNDLDGRRIYYMQIIY